MKSTAHLVPSTHTNCNRPIVLAGQATHSPY